MVYFCYIDESGTPQIPGNTSHYILCGISIPVKYWKRCDRQINSIKTRYGLATAEIHTGWIKREYLEQSSIDGFDRMNYSDRRSAVLSARTAELYRIKKTNNPKALKQTKKNYTKTDAYIHLTFDERMCFLQEIADICAFALRRYFENGETDLFNRIKSRFDNRHGKIVGVRHFTNEGCTCNLCQSKLDQ